MNPIILCFLIFFDKLWTWYINSITKFNFCLLDSSDSFKFHIKLYKIAYVFNLKNYLLIAKLVMGVLKTTDGRGCCFPPPSLGGVEVGEKSENGILKQKVH